MRTRRRLQASSLPNRIAPADGWTLVYTGNPTLGTSTCWEQLEFQTPFDYNGEDNLLVSVLRQSDSLRSVYYRYTATSEASVFSSKSDDDANPYAVIESFMRFATEQKNSSNYRPNTKFTLEYIICPKFTMQPQGFAHQIGIMNQTAIGTVATTKTAASPVGSTNP